MLKHGHLNIFLMPTYPSNRKCGELGCKEPRSKLNSYCPKHGGKEYTTNIEDNIYRSATWKSIRGRQISKQPLCQSCLLRGMVSQAEHIDHVFPHRQIGGQAFTHNLFQSLCQPCHSYKTGQEKQGSFEHYNQDGLVVYGVKDYAVIWNNQNING